MLWVQESQTARQQSRQWWRRQKMEKVLWQQVQLWQVHSRKSRPQPVQSEEESSSCACSGETEATTGFGSVSDAQRSTLSYDSCDTLGCWRCSVLTLRDPGTPGPTPITPASARRPLLPFSRFFRRRAG